MNDRKRSLREQLRKEYDDLSATERIKTDDELIARVLDFPLYKKCDRVFLFASMDTEVNTRDLIHTAYDSGKTVLLPKCYGKGIMEFFAYEGSFAVGKYGILEPTGAVSHIPTADDVMILPGLSFTPYGMRLGKGGGYYDRYLEKHPCITVGLCRERFLMQELPSEWNDLPVDYVITEAGIYICKNGAS